MLKHKKHKKYKSTKNELQVWTLLFALVLSPVMFELSFNKIEDILKQNHVWAKLWKK